MLVAKVHSSYRVVVALCDADLVGKRFEQDVRELDIRASFFKDQELDYAGAVNLLKDYKKEDATFNIVGPKAVKAAEDAGLITEGEVLTIQNIPFTLILL